MDLLWQTIEYLMSHRDRRSWTVQELKNQTVLVIRFAPDIRNGGHLQSFQGADVEKAADLGTGFVPPGVTYKPKSQYQVRRDYKRSVGRFQKRDESQIVHVNSVTNVDIVPGVTPSDVSERSYCKPSTLVEKSGTVEKPESSPIQEELRCKISVKKSSSTSSNVEPSSPVPKPEKKYSSTSVTSSNVKLKSHSPVSGPKEKSTPTNSQGSSSQRSEIDVQNEIKQYLDKIQGVIADCNDKINNAVKGEGGMEMSDCSYCRKKLPPDPAEVWFDDGIRVQFCAGLCKQLYENDE